MIRAPLIRMPTARRIHCQTMLFLPDVICPNVVCQESRRGLMAVTVVGMKPANSSCSVSAAPLAAAQRCASLLYNMKALPNDHERDAHAAAHAGSTGSWLGYLVGFS